MWISNIHCLGYTCNPNIKKKNHFIIERQNILNIVFIINYKTNVKEIKKR